MNYILKSESSLYYESNFSCDNAIFLKLGSESFFITDGRYTTEAKENISKASVIESGNLIKTAREIIRKSKIKTLIYDPKEWKYLEFLSLNEKLKEINFKSKKDFSPLKRVIKTDTELKFIQKAVELGRDGFDSFATFLNSEFDGNDEKSLLFMLKAHLTDFGSLDLSFEPIVAINENSAKPHAIASEKTLKYNDLLLIDAGVKYKRYCSDRTRVANIDKEINFNLSKKFPTQKKQKIYDTVLKAHDIAIEKAKVGMKASEIDSLARSVIEKAGYGKYFVHSTGHGVGLDIHEYPFISAKSDMIIEENMVFTIEPGIYIPNEFGVRIEDMVVMKSQKALIL